MSEYDELGYEILEREAVKKPRFGVCFGDRIGWVRVFGRGFAWKDTREYPLLFSERQNIVRTWRLGHWSFKALR